MRARGSKRDPSGCLPKTQAGEKGKRGKADQDEQIDDFATCLVFCVPPGLGMKKTGQPEGIVAQDMAACDSRGPFSTC